MLDIRAAAFALRTASSDSLSIAKKMTMATS